MPTSSSGSRLLVGACGASAESVGARVGRREGRGVGGSTGSSVGIAVMGRVGSVVGTGEGPVGAVVGAAEGNTALAKRKAAPSPPSDSHICEIPEDKQAKVYVRMGDLSAVVLEK